LADAVALWEGVLPAIRRAIGHGHPNSLKMATSLASALEALGRWDEAESLWRDTMARRRKPNKPDSPLLAGDLAGLGSNLLNQARWSEAEPPLRECLAIREKSASEDWRRFDTMSRLGEALVGQGR
jgi:hypothetical protein